jgi:hypothetical protein
MPRCLPSVSRLFSPSSASMQTLTVVGDKAYPGTLVREWQTHPVHGYGFSSYLSAKLGDGKWMHVEKWDESESDAPSEDELRNKLCEAIMSRP